MAHPTRVKSKALNGIPHLPFQEFATASLEVLVELLKKAKIKDSEIEISESNESQHTTCSEPLVHVMVMTSKGEGETAFKDLAALYQYCPECHLTVRVL